MTKTATYTASAQWDCERTALVPGGSQHFDVSLPGHCRADFPKALRLREGERLLERDGVWTREPITQFRVSFGATGATGTKNETGLRRLERFLARCAELKIALENGYATGPYVAPCNAVSLEQLLATERARA